MISQLINYNAAGTVRGVFYGTWCTPLDYTKPACPSGRVCTAISECVSVTPGGYKHPASLGPWAQTHICDLQNKILMAEAVGL